MKTNVRNATRFEATGLCDLHKKISHRHGKTHAHDIAEFAAIIARELDGANPHTIGLLVSHLRAEAVYQQRYSEAQCNREVTEAEEKRDESRTKRITKLLESIGFGVILNGDPRGCVFKITVPSGFTNDWGREGVCVPR